MGMREHSASECRQLLQEAWLEPKEENMARARKGLRWDLGRDV